MVSQPRSVEMAVVLSGDRTYLNASDFGLASPASAKLCVAHFPAPAPETCEAVDFETAVTNYERTLVGRALQKAGGNKTAAAGMLGMKRTTLIMKLRSLGTPPDCLSVAG